MVKNEALNSSPGLTLEREKADLPGALISQEAQKQVYLQRGPCVPDAPGVTRPQLRRPGRPSPNCAIKTPGTEEEMPTPSQPRVLEVTRAALTTSKQARGAGHARITPGSGQARADCETPVRASRRPTGGAGQREVGFVGSPAGQGPSRAGDSLGAGSAGTSLWRQQRLCSRTALSSAPLPT